MTAGLGDGEILSGTIRQEENGRVRFRFTFPNSEEMTSEWMTPEQERRSVIGWCETVRAEYGNRMAARSRTVSESTAEPAKPSATTQKKQDASTPEDLVRNQIEILAQTAEALVEEISDKTETLDRVSADLTKWLQVAEGLGIDDTIPTIHTQKPLRTIPPGEEEAGDVGGDG